MTVDRETWYRVPRSAEECAVHLEAGGVVEFRFTDSPGNTWGTSRRDFRRLGLATGAYYRLVYSTPVGMSPVIGAPGHAYGLAKDAPGDAWGRAESDADFMVPEYWWSDTTIIEARPPAPAPEPRTEKVPLFVSLRDERKAFSPGMGEFVVAKSGKTSDGKVLAMSGGGGSYVHVDADGLVEVLAEEEA